MAKVPSRTQSIGSPRPRDIASFRLQRHHLRADATADLVTICRDVCGVQAQLMSAASLQLWARNHALTRVEIESALWKTRTLVKTSLVGQTLHLIPADQLTLYITALKRSRVTSALRVMAKFGITHEEADAVTALIVDALATGPLGRAAISAAVRPKVSKRVREWMAAVWSIVRNPVSEGLVCYGPGVGHEVKFIRVDQWLPKMKPISETEEQCPLLSKYLRSYGPATVRDFSKWSGLPVPQIKPLPEMLKDELTEIEIEGHKCLLIAEDWRVLRNRPTGETSVRLLPGFDPFLSAHADKAHLVAPAYFKRVYRNQGWISPVVLRDGKITGIWSYKFRGGKVRIEIQSFDEVSRAVHSRVEKEAAGLARFFHKVHEIVAAVQSVNSQARRNPN